MKKFYSLALLATALLFGCTADGVFGGNPHNINYSSGSSPGNNPISPNDSYCEIYGTGCYKIGSVCGIASESACESLPEGYVESRANCLSYYGSIDCE
jgi:hypothetical protein